jgi:hypothetical protein
MPDTALELQVDVLELQAENAQFRQALAPFASLYDGHLVDLADKTYVTQQLMVGDLRAASRALVDARARRPVEHGEGWKLTPDETAMVANAMMNDGYYSSKLNEEDMIASLFKRGIIVFHAPQGKFGQVVRLAQDFRPDQA